MGSPKLILISIDGLTPEFYLEPQSPTRLLRELVRISSFATRAIPVYPTLTMTNHATIATGAYSDRHGVPGNTRFDPQAVLGWSGGESQDWYMDQDAYLLPTLWDAAKSAGKTVALLRWPVTRGAQVDWLMPEVFSVRGSPCTTRELIYRDTSPELIFALEKEAGALRLPNDHEELDVWTAQAARWLIRNHSPDLMLIHFTSFDHQSHQHGRNHPRAIEALLRIEAGLQGILSDADPSETCFFLFGDHGFMDFTRRVHVNAMLRDQGWIQEMGGKILDWSAIAHTSCAQAPIYVRNGLIEREVISFLKQAGQGRFTVLSRAELDRLRACPGAVAAVDCHEGFSLGQNLSGPWIEDIGCTRGEHGHLPVHDSMKTGFLAWGPGILPDRRLGEVRLLDLAPTAARMLGISLPDADGRPIDLHAASSSVLYFNGRSI